MYKILKFLLIRSKQTEFTFNPKKNDHVRIFFQMNPTVDFAFQIINVMNVYRN